VELLEKFKFRAEKISNTMQIREMSLEKLEDFRLHGISEHYKLGVEVVGVSDLAAQALIR
jgi:hypothetical protein